MWTRQIKDVNDPNHTGEAPVPAPAQNHKMRESVGGPYVSGQYRGGGVGSRYASKTRKKKKAQEHSPRNTTGRQELGPYHFRLNQAILLVQSRMIRASQTHYKTVGR